MIMKVMNTFIFNWRNLILSVFLLLIGLLNCGVQGADDKSQNNVVVDKKTDEVLRGALRWLASKQLPNGAWGLSGDEAAHKVAMSSYAIMAFLSCGHLPGEGEYGKTVAAGVQYLLDQIQPDGIIGNRNDGQYMYSHGLATIALGEIYGQTKSQVIKPKLERLVRLIISSQSREGGWRYRPISQDADISVTVLQVVALRSAKNAGLSIPQQTLDNAVKYVRKCYDQRSGGFSYQPGGSPGFARTSAAIYSLQVCGLYDDLMVQKGSEYLIKSIEKGEIREWFTYGHFYAAPAQYMIGGEIWKKWYEKVKAILLEDVKAEKDIYYWEPKRDRGRDVGPTYCTSIFVSVLAIPYHYIPLYQR